MEEDVSHPVVFLHGDLDLKIIEARYLPNMDLVSERLRQFFMMCRSPCTGGQKKKKHRHHKIITSDPYVTVCVGGATVARTRVISNSQDPVWNERFKIPLAHPTPYIEFYVKDNDLFGADFIGIATVPAVKVLSGETISGWFPIIGSYGKPPKPDCAVHIEMRFVKCEEMPSYRYGMAANPTEFEIRNCYFPLRHGGSVTLYRDAHTHESSMPKIELENGTEFKHESCWEDICHAILEAHHLVYIVGWSIFAPVKLVREPTRPLPNGGNLSLGDLLKYKSEEGVRVLLLVWDDKTSHSKFFINTAGVMQTHDEETRKFFKNSSVSCVLSPRYASSKLSIFKQQVVGTLFTHHQKCVIVDSQAHGNNRKITSFIGGLDLCDGRYDTPEHRLFRDLDTVFQNDYHNPTFSAGTKAPRQPWHDLHCKVEGPAAYDILTNFEQRWRKATKWSEFGLRFKRVSRWHDDSLIKLERISWILSPSATVPKDDPSLWVSNEEDPENWHIQVFRSIDSGSVKGFPKNVFEAESQNLVCAKSLVIDKSIQTAYIQAIRSAQHFIYIENQYFIGSSYAWPSYKEAGADNLIPMELALKIASKIKAKERFAVYVVIPMWPEGAPTSASVQEILFWQGQTIQMMYRIVAQELKSMGVENSHPEDYLNFYCLGNREDIPGDSKPSSPQSNFGETVSASQKFKRFMIYVHSKGMIVDDEYVMIGSANINQRSLAGSRDTEIAMGAYQPYYTWGERNRHPRGQVYGYRMSLWAEHTEKIDGCFNEPESLDCVKTVNKIAEENWLRYTSEAFKPLQGHLLKYPIAVDSNGKVSHLPGQETFPDLGGKILGTRTTLPCALTT
ncbi:ARABIDOPSIS THALIANA PHOSPHOLIPASE D DELTA, phospholipase D delta [Hibiscus trionum]|uniref:Phospholipase D n=1 Tax=Hibiscus trionum TaxID=183268 RepID=A0A9W7IX71_HIBTR|nr:ARABIDOPSIS THALIANA PHOSPHOLIPASE D DELTA, phospholipase D delta [Hibiscus trionum]